MLSEIFHFNGWALEIWKSNTLIQHGSYVTAHPQTYTFGGQQVVERRHTSCWILLCMLLKQTIYLYILTIATHKQVCLKNASWKWIGWITLGGGTQKCVSIYPLGVTNAWNDKKKRIGVFKHCQYIYILLMKHISLIDLQGKTGSHENWSKLTSFWSVGDPKTTEMTNFKIIPSKGPSYPCLGFIRLKIMRLW